jgi:hypothetical protein
MATHCRLAGATEPHMATEVAKLTGLRTPLRALITGAWGSGFPVPRRQPCRAGGGAAHSRTWPLSQTNVEQMVNGQTRKSPLHISQGAYYHLVTAQPAHPGQSAYCTLPWNHLLPESNRLGETHRLSERPTSTSSAATWGPLTAHGGPAERPRYHQLVKLRRQHYCHTPSTS